MIDGRRIFHAAMIAAALCIFGYDGHSGGTIYGVTQKSHGVYSPSYPPIEVNPAVLEELEEESRRWDYPNNIPSWARESPEDAAKRKHYEEQLERAKQQYIAQPMPRAKTAADKVLDAEQRDAEGNLFPELVEAKHSRLQELAKRVVVRIDWNALEKNLSQRILLINEIGMTLFMSGDRGKVEALLKKMEILQDEAVAIIQKADYKESDDNEKLVAENQDLFGMYLLQQMRKTMPRSYWYKLVKFHKDCQSVNKSGRIKIYLCQMDGFLASGGGPPDSSTEL